MFIQNIYKAENFPVHVPLECKLIFAYPSHQSSPEFKSMLEKMVSATQYNKKQLKIVEFDHHSFDHIEFTFENHTNRIFLIFDSSSNHILPNANINEMEWFEIAGNSFLQVTEPETILDNTRLKKQLWALLKQKIVEPIS